MTDSRRHSFPVANYDLGATLNSGQAFRWKFLDGAWEGVIGPRWVRLTQKTSEKKPVSAGASLSWGRGTKGEGETIPRGDFENQDLIEAEVMVPVSEWNWLENYLQLDVDLECVRKSFPKDPTLSEAVKNCAGLRLLRQQPWECLASFILSSTKQIPHIRQIVELLCENYGGPVKVPAGHPGVKSFPTPERIAGCSEAELRKLKMGYRAPFLLKTAQMVSRLEVNLDNIFSLSLPDARNELMRFPGVGRKIADCALLFAFGFQEAFPVDTWILRVLNELYFPDEQRTHRQLLEFTESYFGPHAGYAQQYLFHHIRMMNGKAR